MVDVDVVQSLGDLCVSLCRDMWVSRWVDGIDDHVGKTRKKKTGLTINRWYTLFPNGWSMALFTHMLDLFSSAHASHPMLGWKKMVLAGSILSFPPTRIEVSYNEGTPRSSIFIMYFPVFKLNLAFWDAPIRMETSGFLNTQ